MERLTKERALELHRQMWTDMQKKLGDCPSACERSDFKCEWVEEHGYKGVFNDCFLCEYDSQKYGFVSNCCETCLIDWQTKDGSCSSKASEDNKHGAYLEMPISWILAQPEREVANE